jgi:hypothetical protein
MSDPGLSEINAQVQQAFGPGAKLPSIERAYAEFRPMTEAERLATEAAKEKREAAKEYTGVPPTVPTAPVATAPVVAPEVKATGAIPAAQPQPTEAAPIEAFKPLLMDKLEQDRVLAIRAGFPTRESRGEPKMYLDQKTGETFQGFTTSGRSGFGIYRPDKQGIYSSGVRELSAAELAKPPQAQVDKVYSTSLKALESSVSPNIASAYKGILDSMREQGDIKGMDNALSQAISADRANKEFSSRMALANQEAVNRGDARSQNALMRIDSAIARDELVKGYNTTISATDGAYKALADAEKDKNYSVADILLLRAIAKLTDITTGVREGEYETFASAKGRLSTISTEFANILKDKADRLDAPTRARFVSVLNSKKAEAENKYNQSISRYKNMGKSFGIPQDLLDISLPSAVTTAKPSVPPRNRGARVGQGAQVTKQPADI